MSLLLSDFNISMTEGNFIFYKYINIIP